MKFTKFMANFKKNAICDLYFWIDHIDHIIVKVCLPSNVNARKSNIVYVEDLLYRSTTHLNGRDV